MSAFAIYSDTDSSLTFYSDTNVPSSGSSYNNKTVTAVYTGFDEKIYSLASSLPWSSDRTSFTSVVFNESFASIKPIATAYWFYGFTNCVEINGLEYLDTSKATGMTNMFRGCSSLTTLDVSNFNTESVTGMSNMFRDCSSLTTLDVSNFNTASVTDTQYMFYGCSSLTTLDVSNFNTASVTDTQYMFYDCSSLTTIYSNDNNFVTTAVTGGFNMFSSCYKLVGGNGTTYSARNITHTMAHIDTEENPGYFTALAQKRFLFTNPSLNKVFKNGNNNLLKTLKE